MAKHVAGVRSDRTSTARQFLATIVGAKRLPGGKIISGSNSADPRNTGDTDVLRAGMMMGMRTEDGKYAPSILGALTANVSATESTMSVSAATGTELDRRIAAGGLFKLVGPPTVGGTVAVRTLSYSGTAAGGTITLAANTAVGEIQTCTPSGVPASGTFTITYKDETTSALDWNASVTTAEAALLALPNVNASDIDLNVSGWQSGIAFTSTFADTLGDVPNLRFNTALLKDSSDDEVTIAVVETTPGELVGNATAGATFVIGSLIMPSDGSEAMNSILGDEWGHKVTDEDKVRVDTQYDNMFIAGMVLAKQIVDYPSEGSLQTYVKAQINNNGADFQFDDNFDLS